MRLRVKPKRIISLALAGCMAVSMVPASAVTAFAAEGDNNISAISASAEEGDVVASGYCGAADQEESVKWTIRKNKDDDNYTLILSCVSGQGIMADYPAAKDVPWYSNYMSKITKGIVEKGITHLGGRAFVLASSLSEVELPEGLESIGESCFNGTGITSIKLPNSLKVIGKNAFYNSKLSSEVQIPESVEVIGDTAFNNCKITSANLPKNLKSLGKGAFNATALTEMPEIPKNITALDSTFQNCTGITSVTIPAQVVDISGAFAGTGITSVTIPYTVENYYRAFANCKSLESVIIKSQATAIADGGSAQGAFKGCTSLTTVEFPAWLTRVGDNAFAGDTSLTNPTFLDRVEEIGVDAFSGSGITGSIVLNATKIGARAFDKCANLGSDICLTKVAEIGADAFRDCDNLTEVYVQEGQNTSFLKAKAGKPSRTIATVDFNGGTFTDDTVFEKGKLATPELAGHRFAGWYKNSDFSGDAVTTLEDGENYYAKWSKKSELKTDIGDKTFVVGEPVEFTFSTVANGDKDTMVVGTSNFSDADAIEKLEYYEVKDGNWHELKGDFGVSTGFSMMDAASKFRVTFKKAGDYTFTASMKKVGSDTVLCSTEVNFTVGTMASNATVTDEGGTSMTSYKAGEPVRVTLNAAPNDPEAFKENTLTLTYADEVEKVELNDHELEKKAYKIADLLAMMEPDNAQITVQALEAGKTVTIPLDVTYKTNGEHSFGMTVTNAAGTTVCEQNKEITISDDEPMPVGSHTLTVNGGTVKVNGAKVDLEKGMAVIPERAAVEVTFDKNAFADSGLKFGHWDIEGLEDPNAYQDKESFTFEMPANDVKLTAMTQDASIDDGPDVLGTAAVITTAAVGGAVLAWQGYQIGTELYLTYLLPAGAAIPANTAELAELVWADAGKPAPAAVLPEDAAEEQQAMAWAVESGLISADKSADASVSKMDVIKTWKKAQEMKG